MCIRDRYSTGGTLTLGGGSSLTSTGLIDLSSGSNTGSSGGWELIAKQVTPNTAFSQNSYSTLLENENDSSQSTFMSIGNLNKDFYDDSSGKYKFKQVWGGSQVESTGINKEVIWTQTSWLTDSTIQGFAEIGTSGYVFNTSSGFYGLGKSGNSQCVIDGNGGSGSWFNCAGAVSNWNSAMPGPIGKAATSMYLYIWNPPEPAAPSVSESDFYNITNLSLIHI